MLAAATIGTGGDPECASTFHEGSFRATWRLPMHRKPAVFNADGRAVVRFIVGIPPTRHLRLQLHVACVGMAMAGSCGRGGWDGFHVVRFAPGAETRRLTPVETRGGIGVRGGARDGIGNAPLLGMRRGTDSPDEPIHVCISTGKVVW